MGFKKKYPDISEGIRVTDNLEVFHTLLHSEKEKVLIHDAGHTEVEPNTLTCIAGIL